MKGLQGQIKRGLGLLLAVVVCLFLYQGIQAGGTKAETTAPPAITQAQLAQAFQTAAFSVEYGDQGGNVLHRFEEPILLYAHGELTVEDDAKIDSFLAQLNENIPGFPGITRVDNPRMANVTAAYVPLAQMDQYTTGYTPGNWGYVTYFWDWDSRMIRLEIAIATDVTSQADRNHLFMEELVGGLGLTNDIEGYPDSIIYQPWTTTQQLSDLDWQLLALLYDSRLTSGMSWNQAQKALGWR